jgi:predicted NBD/HSP70 family sugar kinase
MTEKEVLFYIRKKRKVTRGNISEQFNVGPAAITQDLKGLFRGGIITEDGFVESTGGRRSALVTLNPEFGRGIGIEISRRGIRSVLMKFDGSITDERVFSEDCFSEAGSAEKGLQLVYECIRSCLNGAADIKGIGIAVSGIVDRRRGVSVSFPDFSPWSNVCLKEEVEREFGIPAAVEPLIFAALRGEYIYGRRSDCTNLIFIHIGKGISCAAVFSGEIYYGSAGTGGELGHTVAVPDGPLCYCGKYGCLESVASPAFMEREVAEAVKNGVSTRCADNGRITAVDIIAAAGEGDRFTRNVVERAGEYIGRAASNLANIFAPDMIVVSGAVIREEGVFFRNIRKSFRDNLIDSCASCSMEPGKLNERAALAGAGDIAFSHVFDSC